MFWSLAGDTSFFNILKTIFMLRPARRISTPIARILRRARRLTERRRQEIRQVFIRRCLACQRRYFRDGRRRIFLSIQTNFQIVETYNRAVEHLFPDLLIEFPDLRVEY